jgi:ketosteroid isomerase-like protein
MSPEDVEVVRRIYEDWSAVDLGLEHLDPDFELHQTVSLIDSARVFRGHDGLLRAANELNSDPRRLSWEPEDIVDAPDNRIVVRFRLRGLGRASGIPVDMHLVHVWTFRDGLAIRCDTYESLPEALEAAGLQG